MNVSPKQILAYFTKFSVSATLILTTYAASPTFAMVFEKNTDRPGADYKNFDLPVPDYNLCMQACENDQQCKSFTYVKPGVQGKNARCWLKSSVPKSQPSDCCVSGVKGRQPSTGPTAGTIGDTTSKKPTVEPPQKPSAMPNPFPPPKPTAMPDPLPSPSSTVRQKAPSAEGTSSPSGKMAQNNVDLPGMDYKNFDLQVADPRLCQQACQDDPRCEAYTYVRPGIQGTKARCWLKKGVPQAKTSDCCISGIKEERENAAGLQISPDKKDLQNIQRGSRTEPLRMAPNGARQIKNKHSLEKTDKGTCLAYADKALKQVQQRLSLEKSLPKDDPAWINDQRHHLTWCMSHSKKEANFHDQRRGEWLQTYLQRPSHLEVVNETNLAGPNPDDSDITGFEIKLKWKDNSDREIGYQVHRHWLAKNSIERIATLKPNTIEYVDSLFPGAAHQSFCYYVTVDGHNDKVPFSSNRACVTAEYAAPLTLKDTDQDGIPDSIDACPEIYSDNKQFLFGCPDGDGDGYPDRIDPGNSHKAGVKLVQDECYDYNCEYKYEEVWGDHFSISDKGPKPPPGAPVRFRLLWLGMQVLNNSKEIMLNDGTILYDEKDDEPSKGQPARPGEEPYAHFVYINGIHKGDWIRSEQTWCCGERAGIGVAYDGTVLTSWVQPKKYGNNQISGLQIFPKAGGFQYIDRTNGLILGITVLEKDWDRIKEEKNKGFLDTITSLASTVFSTAYGAYTLDGGRVAAGMKSLAEIAYGSNNKRFGTEVNLETDRDDYMGTEVFKISRNTAITHTSKNGVYTFWIQMPTSYYTHCWYNPPCQPGSPPATMLTKQYFCLVREGTSENKINEFCSSDKAVQEIILEPVYHPDIQEAEQKYLNEISSN